MNFNDNYQTCDGNEREDFSIIGQSEKSLNWNWVKKKLSSCTKKLILAITRQINPSIINETFFFQLGFASILQPKTYLRFSAES